MAKEERAVVDEVDEKIESKKKVLEKNISVAKKTEEKDAKKEIKMEIANSDKKLTEIQKETVRQKRKNSNSSIEDEKEAKKPAIEIKKESVSEEIINKKVILKGVVFVLSGFQNPERGDLRDLALKMGAKYR